MSTKKRRPLVTYKTEEIRDKCKKSHIPEKFCIKGNRKQLLSVLKLPKGVTREEVRQVYDSTGPHLFRPKSKDMCDFLLYLVPDKQPELSSQAYMYGGYHITLFPTHQLPCNYSLKYIMEKYYTAKKRSWRLRGKSYFETLNDGTIIMKFGDTKALVNLQKMLFNHGWESEYDLWDIHITLGNENYEEPVSPQELRRRFRSETRWYVQLVKREIFSYKGEMYYKYIWLPNERVRL